MTDLNAWPRAPVAALVPPLRAAADPERAQAMAAYFKREPFLGVGVPERRAAQKRAWRGLATPTADQLCAAERLLAAEPEREFQLAGIELLGRWQRLLGSERLDTDVRTSVLDRPWWDTVDSLNSYVINPMVRARPELVSVMWDWNGTDDQWLVRASIQHQRGNKDATDLDLLFALSQPHTADRRFWVAKAIGWALRDAARVDADAVETFVGAHPELAPVARREAMRGIARAR